MRCRPPVVLALLVALVATVAVPDEMPDDHDVAWAASHDDAARLAELLDAGADASRPAPGGLTPLMLAIRADASRAIAVLLARRVDVDVQDAAGYEAIHYAAGWNRRKAFEALVAAGVPKESRNDAGSTPLHVAALIGSPETVAWLLEAHGLDVGARTRSGATALHAAAGTGRADVVQVLLQHGADRAAKDGSGRDAAAVARERGHEDVAALLGAP